MEAGLLLLREFLRMHPEEAATEIEFIDAEEAAAVLADAPPDEGAPVLNRMGAMAAAQALELMDVPSAVALLCRLEASIAAMLLRRMTLPARQNILFACPEPWKSPVTAHMLMPAGSVATAMDSRAPVFPVDWKVRDLFQYFTANPNRLSLEVFVTTREHGLAGRIDLRTLERRLELRELRGIMAASPPSVALRSPVRAVREDALWRRFDVLPVVDGGGVFVGALSHRALRMAERPDAVNDEPSASGAFVDLAELAWTGYVAAVDVASTVTRNLGARSPEAANGAQDQS